MRTTRDCQGEGNAAIVVAAECGDTQVHHFPARYAATTTWPNDGVEAAWVRPSGADCPSGWRYRTRPGGWCASMTTSVRATSHVAVPANAWYDIEAGYDF